jgi:hypothetical protein
MDASRALQVGFLAMLSLVVACARSTRWPPDPDAWREVRSDHCSFTLRMPGRPRSQETRDPSGIRVTQYSVRLRPGYVYTALCALPANPPKGETGEELVRKRLDAERQAVEKAGWTVREASRLSIGACPASQLVTVDRAGVEFRTRFVWAGDRSFFLGTSGPERPGSAEVATTMFDSFHSPLCGETAPAR